MIVLKPSYPNPFSVSHHPHKAKTQNPLSPTFNSVNRLYRFFINNNNLTETAVDNILQAFVDANRTTNMSIAIMNLGGSGNAAPSAAGVTNKNTLISRGWSVTTN